MEIFKEAEKQDEEMEEVGEFDKKEAKNRERANREEELKENRGKEKRDQYLTKMSVGRWKVLRGRKHEKYKRRRRGRRRRKKWKGKWEE